MKFWSDVYYLFGYHMTTTLRMPMWVVIAVVQPILWLVMFGQLFRVIVELPDFGGASYQQFLTPGLIVMSSVMSAGYTGLGLLNDIRDGVFDQFLATPARRAAILLARVLQAAATVVAQGLLIVVVALVIGVEVPGGVAGVVLMLFAAALLGAASAAASNGLALIIEQQQVLVATINFTLLPATFLSSMIMAPRLMPDWIRRLAAFNPLDWGVVLARNGFDGAPLTAAAREFGLLVLFGVAAWWLGLKAFDRYRTKM